MTRSDGEAMFLRRLARLREMKALHEQAAALHERAAALHDEHATVERWLGHCDLAEGMERRAWNARELQRIERERAETAQGDIEELTRDYRGALAGRH